MQSCRSLQALLLVRGDHYVGHHFINILPRTYKPWIGISLLKL